MLFNYSLYFIVCVVMIDIVHLHQHIMFLQFNFTLPIIKEYVRPANYPDFRGIIPIFIPQPESRYRDRKTSQKPDFHKNTRKNYWLPILKFF